MAAGRSLTIAAGRSLTIANLIQQRQTARQQRGLLFAICGAAVEIAAIDQSDGTVCWYQPQISYSVTLKSLPIIFNDRS